MKVQCHLANGSKVQFQSPVADFALILGWNTTTVLHSFVYIHPLPSNPIDCRNAQVLDNILTCIKKP